MKWHGFKAALGAVGLSPTVTLEIARLSNSMVLMSLQMKTPKASPYSEKICLMVKSTAETSSLVVTTVP